MAKKHNALKLSKYLYTITAILALTVLSCCMFAVGWRIAKADDSEALKNAKTIHEVAKSVADRQVELGMEDCEIIGVNGLGEHMSMRICKSNPTPDCSKGCFEKGNDEVH